MKKLNLHYAFLTMILMTLAFPVMAETIDEFEKFTPTGKNDPNDPIAFAQKLTITVEPGTSGTTVSSDPPKGNATVNGVLGILGPLTGSRVLDLDFYTFQGQKDDEVTIDIDGGVKKAGSTDRSVDTVLGLFGPGKNGPYTLLCSNDDIDLAFPADEGSIPKMLSTGKGSRDALILDCLLPVDGSYTVGVSSYPRVFTDGGATPDTRLNNLSNGTYTLVISGVGVLPPILTIGIDIKPGDGDSDAPINPKSQGKIPVALLSQSNSNPHLNFNALDVDVATLRFGNVGDEPSLSKCNQGGEDVNGDGLLDLVCHFKNEDTGFSSSSENGILTGKTRDGLQFKGSGRLKVVPKKSPA